MRAKSCTVPRFAGFRAKRSNLAFRDEIATLARPAFAGAASRRQAERFSAQARLRAGTFGCAYLLHKDKHFGVQAHTFSRF